MTDQDYEAETKRLQSLISAEDAGKKDPTKTLAQKVEHNRERNRLQDVLRRHKLSYFERIESH